MINYLLAAGLLLAAPAFAQIPVLTALALPVGELAPGFEAKDAAGSPVAPKHLLKQGSVVLYFLPGPVVPLLQ